MINFWASENAFFVVGFWTPIWMKHLFICRRENERKSACQTAESTTRTTKILLAPYGKWCKRICTNVSRVSTHWYFCGCLKSQVPLRKFEVLSAPCANLTGIRLDSAISRPKIFQCPNLSSTVMGRCLFKECKTANICKSSLLTMGCWRVLPADPEHLSRSFVFRAESPNMLVTINMV